MTQITPMKQLKGNVENFKNETKELFNFLALNKVEPKYNPLEQKYSKGVDSDFILLLNPKNRGLKNAFSGAFVFTYLDQSKPVTIQAQLKTSTENDSIIGSEELSVEEFKIRINNLNKELKNRNSNGKIGFYELFNMFKETFEVNNPVIKKENIKELDELKQIAGIKTVDEDKSIKSKPKKNKI